jgi:hypothetical protein
MNDATLVALINGAFGILVLFLGARINRKVNRIKADSSVTRDQVKNSHELNLRDDIDRLTGLVRQTLRDVFDLREELGQVRKSAREQWEVIEHARTEHPSRHTKD